LLLSQKIESSLNQTIAETEPSSLPVVVASLTKDMQTEQVLCWSIVCNIWFKRSSSIAEAFGKCIVYTYFNRTNPNNNFNDNVKLLTAILRLVGNVK